MKMDNNNHKDLENQGWDAMFQTLEREMPVKKKRRGLLWLFLLLGIGAMGGGYWFLKTPNNTNLVQTTNAKPIVQNNSTETSGFLTKKEENTEGRGDTHLRKLSKLPKIKDTIYNNVYAAQKTPPIFQPTNTLTETTNDNNLRKLSKLPKIEDISQKETAPLSIKPDTNLKIGHLPYFEPKINTQATKNKLRWGITAGIHTENGQKLDGYQAGLVVSKPINNRWDWATGLSFRQTKAINSNTTYYLTADINKAAATTALQSTTAISLDKFYYLEIPLTIQYHLNKHFVLATGIKISYLLDQSTKKSGSSVYFVNNGAGSSVSQDILGKINAQTLGLNRWDASWIGGFSYLPNRHINLNLRYDFGLFNTLNSKRWTAYNRYLGLNATYFF